MDHQQQSLRIGAAAIAFALVLRLWAGGFFDPLLALAAQPQAAAFLIYMETGRVVRPVSAQLPTAATVPTETQPAETEPVPVFSQEDAALVDITYGCGYRPDIPALLTEPLDWDLMAEEPTVLILHTHATESYTRQPGESYGETADYRTLDEGYNMISVGARLAELLEAGGITVIHDTTLHDYPSYNGSYENARQTMAEYLAQYPSIRLVLDLHRDAAEDGYGNQIAAVTEAEGVEYARMMLVVGTDGSGLEHPCWQENLALALKLQAVLEADTPGICRSMDFCAQRFNQDMSPGALLIEMGAAGNTREQALRSAEKLAQAILALARGTGL